MADYQCLVEVIFAPLVSEEYLSQDSILIPLSNRKALRYRYTCTQDITHSSDWAPTVETFYEPHIHTKTHKSSHDDTTFCCLLILFLH